MVEMPIGVRCVKQRHIETKEDENENKEYE